MSNTITFQGKEISVNKVHTLILGSGAAGLNAAVQLDAKGIKDILIVTEGLQMGTSINTGSDKQTYYKLGLYGAEPDSPKELADSFFGGGSMHGELALAEAAISTRAFLNLVNLGVKFPQDEFGQFVGYKTDHDPRQRATSFGPYTSREMCRVLIDEIKRRDIPCAENRVAVQLLTDGEGANKRVIGIIAVNLDKDIDESFEVYSAENVVFATGGPGGIYKTSVYPNVHTGAIGLALQAGAMAQSLPESQYGTASIKFRWNVSGTYMQVLPRMISTDADGISNEEEFLRPYFKTEGEMNTAVFLKGYQWPFDPRKVVGGSSIVDILVYIETAIKGRRVFMDFRRNSSDLDFAELGAEAYEYLENSNALFGTPIDRLQKMNPDAIILYSDHGIDVVNEPLEIAVCAQHNNGGLAGNVWWESINVKHLFPIGEVNGTHGVYRPGGSALNSGQVAGFRVADYIAARYSNYTFDDAKFAKIAAKGMECLSDWIEKSQSSSISWNDVRDEFQLRMTKYGSHIRSAELLPSAVAEANKQYSDLIANGSKFTSTEELAEGLRNVQLCFAHKVYLESIKYQVDCGVGSRGSALVMDKDGEKAHELLDDSWCFASEDSSYQDKVLETVVACDGTVTNEWAQRRVVPETNAWFENAWADYRAGKIYDNK
ncbi:FAD-binding protein [Lentisphaerota bacterium WC36G]|nr:FAD-binding protein [Lentisphaerae bacterium WC36]